MPGTGVVVLAHLPCLSRELEGTRARLKDWGGKQPIQVAEKHPCFTLGCMVLSSIDSVISSCRGNARFYSRRYSPFNPTPTKLQSDFLGLPQSIGGINHPQPGHRACQATSPSLQIPAQGNPSSKHDLFCLLSSVDPTTTSKLTRRQDFMIHLQPDCSYAIAISVARHLTQSQPNRGSRLAPTPTTF